VSPSFRTAISIPQNIWLQFREKLYAVGASLLKADCQLQPSDAVRNDCPVSLPTDAVVSVDRPASASGIFSCYDNESS